MIYKAFKKLLAVSAVCDLDAPERIHRPSGHDFLNIVLFVFRTKGKKYWCGLFISLYLREAANEDSKLKGYQISTELNRMLYFRPCIFQEM